MKLLASCLVSCHFDYACISWMSDLSRGWLDKLSQNTLIRLVLGFSRFTHVEVSHFKCFDWLPIESRLEYIKLKIKLSIIELLPNLIYFFLELMSSIVIELGKVLWILYYVVLKLSMVVGLLDILGHFCGINYLWILKIFQVWSVLV